MPRPTRGSSGRRARARGRAAARPRAPSRRGSWAGSRRRARRPTGPAKVTGRERGSHSGSRPDAAAQGDEGGRVVDIQQPEAAGRARARRRSAAPACPRTSRSSSEPESGMPSVRAPVGSSTTSSSRPFVRTATMRPSSSGRNQRSPRFQSGPPVSASATASGVGIRRRAPVQVQPLQVPPSVRVGDEGELVGPGPLRLQGGDGGTSGLPRPPATTVLSATVPSGVSLPTCSAAASHGMSG